MKSENEVAQLCPTLRDPLDCSLPGSSVHGIFQARVLEWIAIAFSVCKTRSIFYVSDLSLRPCFSTNWILCDYTIYLTAEISRYNIYLLGHYFLIWETVLEHNVEGSYRSSD